MSDQARLRADVDIRKDASAQSQILDRFPTNCLVEILLDQGDWVKIKPIRLTKTTSGFVPRLALIFPPQPQAAVFPDFAAGPKTVHSVPLALKLSEFRGWLANGGKPAWLKDVHWNQLSQEQQNTLTTDMTASINADQNRWDTWVQGIDADQRTNEATMEEWIVARKGGQEVYAIRDHYIYKTPAQNDQYFGCAMKGQSMTWTGEIKSGGQGQTRRQFMKVRFYRMSKEMNGWFRADIAQEYVYPDEKNDPEIPANKDLVFDLSTPILRHPQDPEFAAAKAAGYTGAQYIDIRGAIGKALRHFCLCGEICTAALGDKDVIPLLKDWYNPPQGTQKYWRVSAILTNPKEGTSVADLQNLMPLAGLPAGETYPSNPGTPRMIKERLDHGQLAISGCGINSLGVVKANGKIRHWVVLEDILPVGNSGWVRVYNPFQNQEEVYEYNLFMTSAGTGMGLWIDMPQD